MASFRSDVMLEVHIASCISKGQAKELDSSPGGPEMVGPAFGEETAVERTGFNNRLALSSRIGVENLANKLVGPLTDAPPFHPSRQSFDKNPLYAKVTGGMAMKNVIHRPGRMHINQSDCAANGKLNKVMLMEVRHHTL